VPQGNTVARRPLDGFAAAVMMVLCLCWGMQQVAIKAAAPGMDTVLQIGLRSTLAVILLGIVRFCRGEGLALRDGTLKPGIAVGILFASQFLCVATGLKYTTASHMAVFMYTAPVFTALGMHWLVPGEKLRPGQLAGVCVAFVGVAVAFSNGFAQPNPATGNTLPGDTLGVAAGVLWAATTVLIRKSSLAETPSTKTLLYQLGGAAVLGMAAAMISGRGHSIHMTSVVWWSLSFQVLIISFVTFLSWLWMLRRYLAARLSVFSFLTPLFGVTFGVLLLNDKLDSRFVAGAVLVVAGIMLVNWRVTTLSIEGE
jgi:drug/metabolite transporter (DMT)-like permease